MGWSRFVCLCLSEKKKGKKCPCIRIRVSSFEISPSLWPLFEPSLEIFFEFRSRTRLFVPCSKPSMNRSLGKVQIGKYTQAKKGSRSVFYVNKFRSEGSRLARLKFRPFCKLYDIITLLRRYDARESRGKCIWKCVPGRTTKRI